jgi:SAM-dependent methyltransferase
MGRGEDASAERAPTAHERRAGAPWDDSYRDGRAPWDLGRPQPAIARLADEGAFAGQVLDAGCGTGEHTLDLAARGCEVLGIDAAPTAIEEARRKAAERGIAAEFLVADALRLERLDRSFDRVLDVGLFHTLDGEERQAYVAGLAAVTRSAGVVHLLCFSDEPDRELGPHPVGEGELRSAFTDGWTVTSIAPSRIEATFAAALPAWLARIERA